MRTKNLKKKKMNSQNKTLMLKMKLIDIENKKIMNFQSTNKT